jgi:hypothetical protein
LKYTYKIKDPGGERVVAGDDFPIVIGTSPGARITLEDLKEPVEAAHIGLAEGRPFVQTGTSGISVLYNGQKLEGSVRLLHGDRLQIGSTEIVFIAEGQNIIFQVSGSKTAVENLAAIRAPGAPKVFEIEPIAFRSGPHSPRSKPWTVLIWSGWIIVGLIFVSLAASAWFVFTAKQVQIRIDPEPDGISVRGGMVHLRLGNYYLMRPGEYSLCADKKCFQPLQERFRVTDADSQEIRFTMEKSSGLLSLQVHASNRPSITLNGARVYIDGQEVEKIPLTKLEVKPGRRRLQIRADNYQDFTSDVTIKGCGELQSFDFALAPNWSDIKIVSVPIGAEVRIDGKSFGNTPLQIQLPAGTHQLELSAQRFKGYRTQLVVEPDQPRILDAIRLQPADGTLVVLTHPAGANVMVDKTYVGQTPLKIEVASGTPHVIHLDKPGYEKVSRQIQIAVAGSKELQLNLIPQKGVIKLQVDPADAELWLNDKFWGKVPQEIQLMAVEQQLEFKKDGYTTYRTQITPRPGFPQEL